MSGLAFLFATFRRLRPSISLALVIGCCLILRVVTTHHTALIADTRQLDHHFLRILLRHLKVGDGVEQVDMTHLLTTYHETVQRLHQFTRIEPIALAQVDE